MTLLHFGTDISKITIMSFTTNINSLSALRPIEMEYNFYAEEKLKNQKTQYDSNLSCKTHSLFLKYEDLAVSKHTALLLTNSKKMTDVFARTIKIIDINDNIPSTFVLKSNDCSSEEDCNIKIYGGKFYVGGKGTIAVFNILPSDNGLVQLKVNDNFLQIDEVYPFDLKITNEPLTESNSIFRKFVVSYNKQFLTIQGQTPIGMRFLSSGVDRSLKFVGVELNQTKINNYQLIPTFLTSPTLKQNFDPTVSEVRYFNTSSETNNQKQLSVKSVLESTTNLLVSCPIEEIANTTDLAKVNVSLLKTHYSSSGTFNTLL